MERIFSVRGKAALLVCGPVMVVALAGCGGGAKPAGQPTASTPGVTGTSVATPAGALEALNAAADRLNSLQSGRAEVEWQVKREGFDISGSAKYEFLAPDQLHLTGTYAGHGNLPSKFDEENHSELRVVGQSIYVTSPVFGDSWVVFTPAEFGPDWTVVSRLLAAHSPVNYAMVLGGMGSGVEDLGPEGLDGVSYQHERARVNVDVVLNALKDVYGAQGQAMFGNRFSGPVTVDVWLDPATQLPHRLSAEGTFQYLDGPTDVSLMVTFSDLGAAIELPTPPSNAKPVSELAR